MKLPLLIASLVLCLACKNPYTDFYHDLTKGADVSKVAEIPTGDPTIYRGQNYDNDYIQMSENGYLLLGYSSFNAGNNVNKDSAINHGKKIKAAVVLLYDPKYTGTNSGSVPLLMPNNTTTYSSGSATAYGSGGTVNVYGSGTSTTYGTQVVNMPYNVNRYDYGATYWIKDKRPIVFGVEWRDLTPAEKTQIGSNKGARINIVLKQSPAYRADFMRNDIVKKIDNFEIMDASDAQRIMSSSAGKTVIVELLRSGNVKTIEVVLNSPSN